MINYLKNIPEICNNYGFNKVLLVRKMAIYHKHILTDIFVKKKFNIYDMLQKVGINFDMFMEQNTNYLRRIYKIPRELVVDSNKIQKTDINDFYKWLDLFYAFDYVSNQSQDKLKDKIYVVLDFDGVLTDRNFWKIYKKLNDLGVKIIVNSANPNINESWFLKHNLPLPNKVYTNRGKKAKIRKLFELSKRYFLFYIDDEKEYLEYGYTFGCYSYYWNGKKIKNFNKE